MTATPEYPSRQSSTFIVMGLAIASLLWYGSFLFSWNHIGHPVAYALLVVAETIGMTQLLGAWITILIPTQQPAMPEIDRLRQQLLKKEHVPSIVVFVPVAGEPLSVIRRTVTATRDMEIQHRTIILDDGASDAVRSLATELNVEYLSRPVRDGHKAGNINHGLQKVQSDFFAVFDSDHEPKPDFLVHTLPYLLADPKMAFVQTPQFFENREHFVSGGTAEAQEIFYRYIQPGKNLFSAAFCVGTNVIFRREAIDDIGGLYAASNSEDIWTSLLLHERGWRSFFLPTVLAVGQAPERLDSYFRQQFRWARGGMEIFFKRNPFVSRLTTDQKLQYLHTTTYYFTGFSVLIFFLLPLLYVYFGWKPIDAPEGGAYWASRFLPYYAMTFVSTIHLLGRMPKWRTFVMTLAAFPAHIGACLAVLTGFNIRWSATGNIRKRIDYVKSIAPHLLLLLLSLGAIPALLISSEYPPLAPLMILWLLANCAILFSVCLCAMGSLFRSRSFVFSPALHSFPNASRR